MGDPPSRELTSRRLRNLPHLLHKTREMTTLHTLMRWFILGVPVERKAAREPIPDWVLKICLECGMLRAEGEALVPTVMLAPFEHLFIATDRSLKIEAGRDRDLVLAVNPTTWHLYRFMVRKPSRATLDLGAGCGALALAAVAHSESVVATDLNPRATEFASFNARLNGLDRVECLTGKTFEPVAGRTFDLIITNPPFFITPVDRFLFCDNDMDLDQFCRQLVREAPNHLNEGGYLQMMCEWASVRGQSWEERLFEWLDRTGCDAWVFKGHTEEASQYALQRLRELGSEDSPEKQAASYAEWIDYYPGKGCRSDPHRHHCHAPPLGAQLGADRRLPRNAERTIRRFCPASIRSARLSRRTFIRGADLGGQAEDLAPRPTRSATAAAP